jgi:hypothetical protein
MNMDWVWWPFPGPTPLAIRYLAAVVTVSVLIGFALTPRVYAWWLRFRRRR